MWPDPAGHALVSTVLIVEDQAFQRKSLCRLLQRAGVERVLEAEDGESALVLLRACDVDPVIVITDLDMPNVDGIEFIRCLSTEFPAVSVAIYSAQDTSLLRSVRLLAEDLGLSLAGVLSKPANLAQIGALLDSVVRTASRKPLEAIRPLTVDDVRDTFSNGWLTSYFQPKVSLATKATVGCEALARIVHPRLGTLTPARFMTALDAAGLHRTLTDCMLTSAGTLLHELRNECLFLPVSVNLTLPEVSEQQDCDRLTAAVLAMGATPEQIVFEITETALATDWTLAVENLSRLRMKGFRLSIDDFGTGYSSLQQLLRIPFSELKLDRSFIHGIEMGAAAYTLVEGTIRMAKKLGLTTVAEGIETPIEAQTMLALDCDVGQGNAFSRPLPLADFLKWLGPRRAVAQ
jgi:EAL domain-containing protein (putative c-di-GMP-specific phosphodiesterase class I)/ActR/RegA family two-component response regulator